MFSKRDDGSGRGKEWGNGFILVNRWGWGEGWKRKDRKLPKALMPGLRSGVWYQRTNKIAGCVAISRSSLSHSLISFPSSNVLILSTSTPPPVNLLHKLSVEQYIACTHLQSTGWSDISLVRPPKIRSCHDAKLADVSPVRVRRAPSKPCASKGTPIG